VLDLALALIDVRAGLCDDRGGTSMIRLRAQALEAADEMVAAAGNEYRTYCAARTEAGRRASVPGGRFPTADGALWPVLAVLLPLVSAVAAAVLLLVGYGLRLAGRAEGFAASVAMAGWMLALVAVVTLAVGLWALLRTALRRRDEPPDGQRLSDGVDVERARERWQEALLERGVLPYLRLHLPESLAP
jgi:hypothetical protein